MAAASDFDVVLSWGEQPAFALALLLALTPRRRMAHLAILMRPCFTGGSSGPKRWIRRPVLPLLARHGIDRLVVPAPRQRQLVTERWRVAPGRFIPAGWSVDTRFWRPLDGPQDMICSVGREMRDYSTLIAALQGLNIPCHLANGSFHQDSVAADDPDASNIDGQTLPASEAVGHKSPVELYRRSRLVVVPIMASDSDNGVSTIQEAMAMGRAVISTATAGRAEILEDGANCLLVPERDPDALRAAIERLWNDPELCARLGANGPSASAAATTSRCGSPQSEPQPSRQRQGDLAELVVAESEFSRQTLIPLVARDAPRPDASATRHVASPPPVSTTGCRAPREPSAPAVAARTGPAAVVTADRPRLRACVVTLNEELDIAEWLRSLAFCDETVVVDSGSVDRTRDLAAQAGARVVTQPWLDFAAQRNAATDHVQGRWVLEVDADERVSPAFAAEIAAFAVQVGIIPAGRAIAEQIQAALTRPFTDLLAHLPLR